MCSIVYASKQPMGPINSNSDSYYLITKHLGTIGFTDNLSFPRTSRMRKCHCMWLVIKRNEQHQGRNPNWNHILEIVNTQRQYSSVAVLGKRYILPCYDTWWHMRDILICPWFVVICFVLFSILSKCTVETLYSTIYYSKYFIELNFDKSTQYVALWTHKRHPIPRPFGRAMECPLWVLQQKLTVL